MNISGDKYFVLFERPANTTTKETRGKEREIHHGIPRKKLQIPAEYERDLNKRELDSHWISHSYIWCHIQAKKDSKKDRNLLNVLWQKQQAGNIHACKEEINNYLKCTKSTSWLIHFEISTLLHTQYIQDFFLFFFLHTCMFLAWCFHQRI